MVIKHPPIRMGEHSLTVFDESRFAHLRLRLAPQPKRTHWMVEHEGRTLAIPRVKGGWGLVHILRDPAHKGNVLVLRKQDMGNPWGETELRTVNPAGDEHFVGAVVLTHQGPHLAYLHRVGIVPFALRKPASKNAAIEQLKKVLLTRRPDKEWVLASERLRKLEQSLEGYPTPAERPPGRGVYGYRKHKLGELLIALAEDMSRQAGASQIHAHFYRDTLGKGYMKHGYVTTEEEDVTHFPVRKNLRRKE